MVPFFHIMISYRVSTEATFARQMYDRLLLNSFKRIPEVGMSQWPDGFSNEKHRPGLANVFLDQVCLKTGENWKHSDEGGGFVGALLKSLIFVPLLSWKVEPENKDDPESKKKFKGSLGEMVARYSGAKPLHSFIDPDPVNRPFCDAVDNVLLELILAMELHTHLKQVHKGATCMHPCFRLFPIVVDQFPDYNQLPDKVSELTYAEASKHLISCGIPKPDKKTVRGVVQYFFDLQGEKLFDLGREDLALDALCSKIISAVCDVVSRIDPLSFFESKPLCAELHFFLSERNCSYMTRILASNNITSLRQLSFLTHQKAIYGLAKQCSSVSSKPVIAELTTLTSVIEESRHDEASWLLSARLNRFVDRDASFETVIKSSSAIIISCAQKSWLTLYSVFGVVYLVLGFMSVFSSGPGGNTIFDFVCSVGFLSMCLASVVHSPRRGYVIFCCTIPGLAVSTVAGFCIDFIKNGSFSLDNETRCSNVGSQLQTSFRTCAIAQILSGPMLMIFNMSLLFYMALQRQDLVWPTFFFYCATVLIAQVIIDVCVLGYSVSASSVITNYVILFFLALVFIYTEWINHRARRKARQIVEKDEIKYQASWKALCESPKEHHELKQLETKLKLFGHVLESSSTVDVLQDCKDIDVLYARAEFINDAFQSLVSLMVEQHENHASSIQELILLSLEEDHQIIDQISQRKEHTQKNSQRYDIQQHMHSTTMSSHVPLPNLIHQFNIGAACNQSIETAVNMREITRGYAHQQCDEAVEVATSLRRGPVKLPSRAIAKVSRTVISILLHSAHNSEHAYVLCASLSNAFCLCCNCFLILAAELPGVQKPGEPTHRHRAFQCRMQLVRLCQRCGGGAQHTRLVVSCDFECLCRCLRLMLRLQVLLSVGFVRPLERSSSGNILVKRCTRMIPMAVALQLPMVESDSQPMLENTDNSQISGKILEILRVRNRFVEGSAHSSGGFRDLAFKVKLGYQVLAVESMMLCRASISNCFNHPILHLQESSSGTPQFVPVYERLLAYCCIVCAVNLMQNVNTLQEPLG